MTLLIRAAAAAYSFRTILLRTLPDRTMMLRTPLILLLSMPQAVPTSSALALAPSQGAAQETPSRDGAEAAETLARDFASWRADRLTSEVGPATLQRVGRLVQRAEALAGSYPDDQAAFELLRDLYAAEFNERERRSSAGELRAVFLQRLSTAHSGSGGMALAASTLITPERLEALVSAPLQDAGALDVTGEDPTERRSAPRARLLAEAVREALSVGDEDFIRQLGSAGSEPLAELAAGMTGERLVGAAADPLALLAEIDPARALDVALAHVSLGDLLLKLAVVDAFTKVSPFQAPSVWEEAASGASLVRPEWASVVAGLYEEPAVPVEAADPFLLSLVERDYAPGALGALVPGCLARGVNNISVWTPLASNAAEELILSDDVASKVAGVRVKLRAAEPQAAWSLARESDPGLREWVARSFVHQAARSGARDTKIVGAQYREALEAFLGSSDERSAGSAIQAVYSSARAAREDGVAALKGTLLVDLIGRPGFGPEAVLASLEHLPTLSGDEQSLVVEAAAKAVVGEMNGRSALDADAVKRAQSLFLAAVDAGQMESLLAVLDAQADAVSWGAFVETSRTTTGLTRFPELLRRLSQGQQQRMIRGLWRVGYDNFSWLDGEEWSLRPESWLELIGDENLPLDARAWAIKGFADAPLAPAPKGAAGVLARAAAAVGEMPLGAREMESVGIVPADYFARLLEVEGAPDAVVLGTWIPLESGPLLESALKRFPPKSWPEHSDQPLLSSLISGLVERRDPKLNGDLLYANVARTAMQSYLIRALHFERFEGHLPVGGAILKEGMTEQEMAIEFVARFTSDEAARQVIEAMQSASTPGYRDKLFAALEGMNARRAAADQWRSRGSADDRRSQAISQLLEVIDRPSAKLTQRVQAVRGLGLLGAVEELPRLIELLTSDEEKLRAAAVESIDRLGQKN